MFGKWLKFEEDLKEDKVRAEYALVQIGPMTWKDERTKSIFLLRKIRFTVGYLILSDRGCF